LIKDDDEDEGNDNEQSDIVSIILNLSFLPEYVSEKFHFQSGFSKGFKQAIEQQRIGAQLLNKMGGAGGLGMKLPGLTQK